MIALSAKAKLFLAPLGVGDHLVRWGIPAEKVRQLDWWDSTEVDGIDFVPCTQTLASIQSGWRRGN